MLVDNKFIYINMPRCASASFHISCIRNNLNLKFLNDHMNAYDLSLTNDKILETITHPHERLIDLDKKFGNTYEIIAVKRDRHERFISFWNFFISSSKSYGDAVYNTVKSLKIEDILFFDKSDILDNNIGNTINKFLITHDFLDKVDDRFKNLLGILIKPSSYWHNDDSRIKWFDFKNLTELENWVSKKIERQFKLEKSSSTKNDAIHSVLDINFIKTYNKIYDDFDLTKTNKTLI